MQGEPKAKQKRERIGFTFHPGAYRRRTGGVPPLMDF